jgi:hypothetical protein
MHPAELTVLLVVGGILLVIMLLAAVVTIVYYRNREVYLLYVHENGQVDAESLFYLQPDWPAIPMFVIPLLAYFGHLDFGYNRSTGAVNRDWCSVSDSGLTIVKKALKNGLQNRQ